MTIETEHTVEPLDELKDALQEGNKQQLETLCNTLSPSETARAVLRLDSEDQTQLLTLLEPKDAAEVITTIPEEEAAHFIEELPTDQAAPIIEELRSNHQADLLNYLTESKAEQILESLSTENASEIKQLMTYPEDTAGSLMITEYLAYPEHFNVDDVLADLRQQGETYADYAIQYAYVISKAGKLMGVLRLRDLLLSVKTSPIEKLMISNPLCLKDHAHLNELQDFFNQYAFLGVPVVSDDNVLVGIVSRFAVEEAVKQKANKIFLKVSGIVGGEEYRSMSLFSRSSRRLSWLSVNIVLNIVAASVIAFYQDTLEKAITLAVFLPIISDMSGCSGNQAVAVSMRELSLGLVRPKELWRVFSKEAAIGIVNGIVLGCLLGGVALLWKGNPYLGLVVGGALATNTLLAVCLGGSIPLVLRRLKVDPALASGPLLTTITDMCGFFFVLSFATIVLSKISG
ncbi:MAG: magnesium transporter [SAR324 cluster bacterium]|nr:magnesium transporter [SAR324 cluster bacterium]